MRVRKGDAEKDFSFCEDEILKTFIKIGSSFLAGMNNAFDCVAHAQHFGLPTRLIDWSKNPLVSLFLQYIMPTERDATRNYYVSQEKKQYK